MRFVQFWMRQHLLTSKYSTLLVGRGKLQIHQHLGRDHSGPGLWHREGDQRPPGSGLGQWQARSGAAGKVSSFANWSWARPTSLKIGSSYFLYFSSAFPFRQVHSETFVPESVRTDLEEKVGADWKNVNVEDLGIWIDPIGTKRSMRYLFELSLFGSWLFLLFSKTPPTTTFTAIP